MRLWKSWVVDHSQRFYLRFIKIQTELHTTLSKCIPQSGFLDVREVHVGFRAAEIEISYEETARIVRLFDADRNQQIDLPEFIQVFAHALGASDQLPSGPIRTERNGRRAMQLN